MKKISPYKKIAIAASAFVYISQIGFAQNVVPVPGPGPVGIYTTNPTNPLHVVGKARFDVGTTTGSGGGRMYLTRNSATNYECMLQFGSNGTSTYDWVMGSTNSSTDWYFGNGGGRVMSALTSNGNVGIGSISVGSSPAAKLSVGGDFLVSSSGTSGAPYITHNAGFSSSALPEYTWYGYTNTGVFHPNPGNIIGFSCAGTEAMRIGNGTNPYIGIGTTNPSAPLTVIGKVLFGNTTTALPGNYNLYVQNGILTEKLRVALVNSADWADYVFEKEYKLRCLSEVEKFVNENKHLPEVPSAHEVEENGVDMVEMDACLLKKIEELTLYLIKQEKQIDEQKKRLELLERELGKK